MQVELEVANINKIAASLQFLGDDVAAVAMAAAIKEAQHELPMTRVLVPFDTGQLFLSGRVEMPDPEAGTLAAGIAYGGPAGAGLNEEDVDYALPVHEDLAAHHPHGQAKFVESVIQQELANGGAANRMGADIREVMAQITAGNIGRFAIKGGYWLKQGGNNLFTGSKSGL